MGQQAHLFATVNGREYRFAQDGTKADGAKLWPVTIEFATELARLPLSGPSVDLGGGLGLIASVTGAVLIERDPQVAALAKQSFKLNGLDNEIIVGSWADCNRKFDNVFASEVIYPSYDVAALAEFINRCWTRKGICAIANGSDGWKHRLEDGLNANKKPHYRESRTTSDVNYFVWRLF